MDSILVSSLKTNAITIIENNTHDQLDSTKISIFETELASILKNNVIDHLDSTLVSNINTISSLLLPPNILLSFDFKYVTGVYYTYHPLLYKNHVGWSEPIIPTLELLVFSLIRNISSCSVIVILIMLFFSQHWFLLFNQRFPHGIFPPVHYFLTIFVIIIIILVP